MTRSDSVTCDCLTTFPFQEELMEVVRSVGLEVVRWETTVRCSTHYFTILRRKGDGNVTHQNSVAVSVAVSKV